MDFFEIRFQFLTVHTANLVMSHAQKQENVDCKTRGVTSLDIMGRSLDDMATFMRDMKQKGIINSVLCMEHLRLIDHARGDLAGV